MSPLTSADGARLRTDCLDTLDSLSVTSLVLSPSKSSFTGSRTKSSRLAEDLTVCTDHFVRTTELLKARAELFPDGALLDLQDRLRSVPRAISKSSRDHSSSLNLLKDIRRSTQILDSFRKTVDLLDKINKALDDLAGSVGSDTEDYIDGMNEEEDIPLPPPLKVSGTCWPERRVGAEELLRQRAKANADASQWQKGVLKRHESHGIRSLAIRSKHTSRHGLIKVSATRQGGELTRTY